MYKILIDIEWIEGYNKRVHLCIFFVLLATKAVYNFVVMSPASIGGGYLIVE